MRKFLGVVAGVVALGVTVLIVEMIGHTIWVPPAGVDVSEPVQLAVAAPLAGGWLATKPQTKD